MNPKLFLSGLKNSYVHTFPVCKSNLPVHTYPTRIQIHSRTQNSSENIGNRACVVKRAICTLLCLESTWERGCHLEYSIHGKELGSILLKPPDEIISGFSVHTIPDSQRFIKNFHSRERIRMPDSPETCGRKPYPEIKIADLKISKEM